MTPELNNQFVPRYQRVYNYYKEMILGGQLLAGSRLPSIRRCAEELQISRTTVETAYFALAADGYILSRPQSGYYVTDIARVRRAGSFQTVEKREELPVVYNFASANVDKKSFRFELWRRYIKSALRQDGRLLSYGEPQGERDLREALCRYLQSNRNVVCSPEHIVIGAGVQSLLHILCPLIKERKSVVFQNQEFRQGRAVFGDYGFRLENKLENFSDQASDIFYLSPAGTSPWEETLSVPRRMELLSFAAERDVLLIEDDYDSEFLVSVHPEPSIQGLAGGRGVVYLGTFSRLLLPSIRISYMVLPPEILERYAARRDFYNQTASKAEQIALCQFIRDGHLESQLRKSKKLYQAKTRALCLEAERLLGDRARIRPGKQAFLSLIETDTLLSMDEIVKRASLEGIRILPGPEEGGKVCFALSCAAVEEAQYRDALQKLKRCIFENG